MTDQELATAERVTGEVMEAMAVIAVRNGSLTENAAALGFLHGILGTLAVVILKPLNRHEIEGEADHVVEMLRQAVGIVFGHQEKKAKEHDKSSGDAEGKAVLPAEGPPPDRAV